MNMNTAQSNHKFVVICFTLLALTTATTGLRLVSQLIHRHSIDSPYYNPAATKSELAARARASSFTRLAYLFPSDHRAGIVPEESAAQFMTKINVGSPPVPQLLTIDTGSNLLWVQCRPCLRCFQQLLPVFDPSESSSYSNISCGDPFCSVSPPRDRCDYDNNCMFRQQYMDSTTASGVMATEKLTFETSDSVSGVVFGCAYDNDGYNGQYSGILGLGADSISLVTRLGSRFSYCIGSIRDPSNPHNFLVLGDGAKFQGETTKLEVVNKLYHLTVTGMSIDTRALDIDPKTFRRSAVTGNGGVVIDSGTTITYLASGAFEVLSKEVIGMLEGKVERVVDHYGNPGVCYRGLIERDLIGFPVVTFHFEGGAELGLDTMSLFTENGEGEFCLAVEESVIEDMTVIGIMAQQSYNIGYDVRGGTISFQRMDCDVFEKMLTAN